MDIQREARLHSAVNPTPSCQVFEVLLMQTFMRTLSRTVPANALNPFTPPAHRETLTSSAAFQRRLVTIVIEECTLHTKWCYALCMQRYITLHVILDYSTDIFNDFS